MGIRREKEGKGIQGQANSEPQNWLVFNKSCISTMKDQRGEAGGQCCEEVVRISLHRALPRGQLMLLWLASREKTWGMGDNLLTLHFIITFLLFFWNINEAMKMGWLQDWATSPCHTWSAWSSQRGSGNGSSGGLNRDVASEGSRNRSLGHSMFICEHWNMVGSCEIGNAQ